jgi:predicted MFS family arabinose efflux permease
MTILRVFLPFAFGYFLSYLYRVVNAVLAPDLVADLDLDAANLGFLTSAYFLAFAAAQLPLGIFLDRFGPRRSEAGLLLFAAAGAFLFATATTTTGLIFGRALIGFGVGACLMAALKAYVIWVPGERLPLINGFHMSAGGLGAFAATKPVEMALQFTDWRGIFFVLAALTVLSSAIIFLFVPEREGSMSKDSLADQLRGVGRVFSSPVFWRITPLTVLSQASFLAVQGLWVGPWLADVGGLERGAVANTLSIFAATTIVGFLVIGVVTERLARFGIRPLAVAIFCMTAFIIVQADIVFGLSGTVLPMWVVYAFFGTSGIVSFAVLSQSFPPDMTGRVLTGINVLVFSFSFLGQWITGAVIDLWPPTAGGGYAPEGYTASFAILLGLQVLALAWFTLATWRGWGVVK